MEITPQITVPINSELYQSVLKSSSFKPGSTLILRVLELQGDRALIDFGNFRASAEIKIPVTLGEELLVRVQESGKQLKLALIDAQQSKILTNESLPQLRQHSGDQSYNHIQTELKQVLNHFLGSQSAKTIPKQILNIFSVLSAHFESFDLDKIVTEIMPRLKSYIQNSGFFFEKMLETGISNLKDETNPALTKQIANHPDIQAIIARDLKANLLALKNNAADAIALQKALDVKSLGILRKAVDLLLTDITNQQGRAVQQFDTPKPYQMFAYTLPLATEKQSAKLKIYYQKKQKTGSNNGFQISLLLSMDRLGDLRTDFHLFEKDLTVTFYVKDQITKRRIQENYQELPELLNSLFNQILLRVIVSERKIKDFDHEDIPMNNDRRVDLRI